MVRKLNENPSLDSLSEYEFLSYASSVIYSRAIPLAEDGLKPIHRRILYTLYKTKLTSDKEPKKSMATVGEVLKLSPHGDTATYEALVRLAQWWKLRYPLVEMQGNAGNLLGDPAAAARYTNCRLSKIGDLMLSDIEKQCVDFHPNYDESMDEPSTLPSRFPNILCNPSSGIAVGISSDLAPHNFTEVMQAVEYYLNNKTTTTIDDILKFIKGPDYPTGGLIYTTQRELHDIYSCGRGSFKVFSHYDVGKQSIVFHDIPYGTTIDGGVKAALHKLILDEGNNMFESIDTKKVGPLNFDITIGLTKNVKPGAALEVLFSKTKLSSSVKLNQTFIVNGEPRTISLLGMIKLWCSYRSQVIQRIAARDLEQANKKLTIILGLKKCTSNIDLLVSTIRNADSRAQAKTALIKIFEINDVQADAVLDMKLSRLNKLDVVELDKDAEELNNTAAHLKNIVEDEATRDRIIIDELHEIKKIIGDDPRRTEIIIRSDTASDAAPIRDTIKHEYLIYEDGLHGNVDGKPQITNQLVDRVFAYSDADVFGFTKEGQFGKISNTLDYCGGMVLAPKKNKIAVVTANGNVKVSSVDEYTKAIQKGKIEQLLKLKDGDSVIAANFCDDNDFIILLDATTSHILKLAVSDLPVASKATVGVKSGYNKVAAAVITSNASNLLMTLVDKDDKVKGKLCAVSELSVSKRGSQGMAVPEGTCGIRDFPDNCENIYITYNIGTLGSTVARTKVSLKGRTAIGAAISNRSASVIKEIL